MDAASGPNLRVRGDAIAVRFAEGAGTVRDSMEVAGFPLLTVTDEGEKLHGAPTIPFPIPQLSVTVLV